MCCDKKCLKGVNIFFAILLLLMAAVQIAGGSFMMWYMYQINRPETLGHQNMYIPPLAMILFGIAVLPLIALACCGFCREVSCSVNLFSTILLTLSLLQLALGAFIIFTFTKDNSELVLQIKDSFAYSFRNYKNDPRFVDRAQQLLHCCGINSPNDWTNGTLSWSCCAYDDYRQKPCKLDSPLLFKGGCVEHTAKFILLWERIIGYSLAGYGAAEIIMAIMGYSLGCGHFKNSYVV